MRAVFKREFFSAFHRLYGFVAVAVLSLFSGILFIFYNLNYASENIASMLSALAVVAALVIPVVAIGAFPSGKREDTDSVYDMMPVSSRDVVLGKYLSALSVIMLPNAVVAVYPAISGMFGNVDHMMSYSAFLGFLLFEAAWLAVCMLIAKLCKSRVRAYIWSYAIGVVWYFAAIVAVVVPTTRVASFIALAVAVLAIGVALYFATKKVALSLISVAVLGAVLTVSFILTPESFAGLFETFVGKLSIFDRYNNFTYGLFDLESILFYLTVIALFVFLTWRKYEERYCDTKEKTQGLSLKKATSLGLALLLMLASFAVNTVAAALPDGALTFDATMANKNSVSKEAEAFLEGIDKQVTVYLLEPTGLEDYELYLQSLAASNENIILKKVYYSDTPEFYSERGINTEDMTANSLVVECGDNSQYLSYLNLFYYSNAELGATQMSYTEYNYYYSLFTSNEQYVEYLYSLMYNTTMYFNADTVICTYIEYVAADVIPMNYYLTGHGEKSLKSVSNPYCDLGLTELDLSQTDIPEDAASILVNMPTEDISDGEKQMLLDYLSSGGQLTFITDSSNLDMENLCAVLAAYGMSAEKDIVKQTEKVIDEETEEETEKTVTEFAVTAHTDNDVMAYLEDMSSVNIKVKDANAIKTDDTAKEYLTVIPLLSSAETSYIGDDASAASSYTVACAAETPDGARVAWFTGGESFNVAADRSATAVVLALNWVTLVYESELPTIPAIAYAQPMTKITSGGSGLLSVILIAAPLCIACFGVIVYYKRKKAK